MTHRCGYTGQNALKLFEELTTGNAGINDCGVTVFVSIGPGDGMVTIVDAESEPLAWTERCLLAR